VSRRELAARFLLVGGLLIHGLTTYATRSARTERALLLCILVTGITPLLSAKT